MKVKVWVEVDITFMEEGAVIPPNKDTATSIVTKCLQAAMGPIITHDIADCISEEMGFHLEDISATVGNE